ncbi:MAG: DUF6599 family protein [Deferrisomatales bacterium]
MERHTPDSLWEKINGEAELYRRFGLREAAFAYFEHPGDPARGLEVSAFALAEPLGAFGVWAGFRPAAARVEPLGNGGFRDDYQAALWHGAVFVRLHAFGDGPQRVAVLEQALAAVTRRLGAAPPRPAVLRAFEGLTVPGTARLSPDHLLGRRALPPGLEGRAPEGYGAFLSLAGTGDLAGYRALLREGRAVPVPGGEGYAGVDPDLGPVTWGVRGQRLAGLRAPPEAPGAARVLEALLEIPAP